MHQLQNTNLNLKRYEYGVVAFYVNLKNCSAQNINYSLNLHIKTEILQIKKKLSNQPLTSSGGRQCPMQLPPAALTVIRI